MNICILLIMTISKKLISINKNRTYNAEIQLHTINEIENNNQYDIEENVPTNINTVMNRMQNNNRVKNSFSWLVFMLLTYYIFYN